MNIDIQRKSILAKNSYIQAETFRRKLQPLRCSLYNALLIRPQESRLYDAYNMIDEMLDEVIKEVDDKRAVLEQYAKEEYEREDADLTAQNLS